MPLLEGIGLGAAALFGIGLGAKAFSPIIAPALGKMASAGARGLSFGARKVVWPMAKGIFTGGTAGYAAKSLGGTALNIGAFAIRHPYMTAGAIGAGAYLATQSSPYSSPSAGSNLNGVRMSASFNEEQMAAQALNESGISPMGGIVSGATMRNQRLMQSTYGLTQGLHASRH